MINIVFLQSIHDFCSLVFGHGSSQCKRTGCGLTEQLVKGWEESSALFQSSISPRILCAALCNELSCIVLTYSQRSHHIRPEGCKHSREALHSQGREEAEKKEGYDKKEKSKERWRRKKLGKEEKLLVEQGGNQSLDVPDVWSSLQRVSTCPADGEGPPAVTERASFTSMFVSGTSFSFSNK